MYGWWPIIDTMWTLCRGSMLSSMPSCMWPALYLLCTLALEVAHFLDPCKIRMKRPPRQSHRHSEHCHQQCNTIVYQVWAIPSSIIATKHTITARKHTKDKWWDRRICIPPWPPSRNWFKPPMMLWKHEHACHFFLHNTKVVSAN